MPSIVSFQDITKAFGSTGVLLDLNLSIEHNDFMVIYGLPSSGKSVLLRLLMGLDKPDRGEISIRGRNASRLPPNERNLGYVPQDFALFPQKSIFENIAYPLRVMRRPDTDIKKTVQRAVNMLSIEDLLDKLPTQLSGGQKQRVAIARGIVKETEIYVFDDPLAGLDFKLREKLFDDLKVLQQHLGATFIYTTSDPLETMALATTVAVLHDCKVQEIGTPEALYSSPKRLATMEILGIPEANKFPGKLFYRDDELWCRTDFFTFQVTPDSGNTRKMHDTGVIVGTRSESITPAAKGKAPALRAKVFLREDLGSEEIVYLDVGGIEWTMIQTDVDKATYDLGESIGIDVESPALFVFDAEGGKRIGRGRGNIHV
jgi:ABC-type sugar transport system ATPase subunit